MDTSLTLSSTGTAGGGAGGGGRSSSLDHGSPKSVSKLSQRLGFIGGGQMALALAKGFMQAGLVAPTQVS